MYVLFRSKHRAALPVKRLWLSLVHQEALQDVFVRYIFRKRKLSFKVCMTFTFAFLFLLIRKQESVLKRVKLHENSHKCL